MARVARVLLACAAFVAVVAPGAAVAAAPDWTRCGDGMECTTIAVSRVHGSPAAGRLDLRVARVPATDAERRIGILVVNPGGPGVASVDRLGAIATALPDQVRERFDVVSFDPRGVDESTHVDCADSLDGVFDHSFSPASTAERAELVVAVRGVVDACARRYGERLARLSTVDTAHDLDAVRRALGERRVSFLGYSYGTYLGAVYAALHPGRVRALVLDGAVDPGLDALESVELQARGFETNLDAFLTSCAAEESCAFHRGGRSTAAYDTLRARLAAAPLSIAGVRDHRLNDTRFDAAVLRFLYGGRASWDALARALDAADRGDGAGLLDTADRFLGRRVDGSDDDTVEAFWAISCLDGPPVDGIDAMAAIEAQVRDRAPRLGGFLVNFSLPCAVWPARAAEAAPSIAGAAPGALVVSTTRDPATPLVSAERLAATLGDAALVVVRADRHTAFAGGSTCVDEAVTDYLVSSRSPPDRVTRC